MNRRSIVAALSLVVAGVTPAPRIEDAHIAATSEHVVPAVMPVLRGFFERNDGQADADTRYLVRLADGGAALLRETGAEFRTGGDVVAMEFVGARPNAPLSATGTRPGRVNYLVGHASRWVRGAPTFDRVRQSGVWPGIDVVWRLADSRLEYDFEIAPGADLSSVRLRFEGLAAPPRVDEAGDLVLAMRDGEVRHRRPEAFQVAPDGRRERVASAFVVEVDEAVSFDCGAFDSARALIVDPAVVTHALYLSNSGAPSGIGVDAAENVYITGVTSSAGLPTTTGSFRETMPGGGSDWFVASFTQDGTELRWLTYVGGSRAERPFIADAGTGPDIAVTKGGVVHVFGTTNSEDFPVTAGAVSASMPGFVPSVSPVPNYDAAYAVLDATGASLLYATWLGGRGAPPDEFNADEYGVTVALREFGNGPAAHALVAVAGMTRSTDFPTLGSVFQPVDPDKLTNGDGTAKATNQNAFVALFRHDIATGAVTFQASTYLGAAPQPADFSGVLLHVLTQEGRAVAVLPDGSVAVTGYAFGSTETYMTPVRFPTTAGAISARPVNGEESFLTILSPGLGAPSYSTLLAGDGCDLPRDVAASDSGWVAVVGGTASSDFPLLAAADGTIETPQSGGATTEAFVTVIDDTRTLRFSTFLGGSVFDDAFGVAFLPGGLYVTGRTSSDDFPLVDSTRARQGRDGFLARFTPSGALALSALIGGSSSDDSFSIAVGKSGAAYLGMSIRTLDLGAPIETTHGPPAASNLPAVVRVVEGESNVTAVVKKGKLTITGDAKGNQVEIREVGAGEFRVTGLAGTKVNGEAVPFVAPGITGPVAVSLGDGDDTLVVPGATAFPSSLTITTGTGSDTVSLNQTVANGLLRADMGTGDTDSISFTDSELDRAFVDLLGSRDGTTLVNVKDLNIADGSFALDCAGRKQTCTLTSLFASGLVRLTLRATDDSTLTVTGGDASSVAVTGIGAVLQQTWSNSRADGATFDFTQAANASLTLTKVTVDPGDLVFRGSAKGRTFLSATDLTVGDDVLVSAAGAGGKCTLRNAMTNGDVKFKFGGTTLHELEVVDRGSTTGVFSVNSGTAPLTASIGPHTIGKGLVADTRKTTGVAGVSLSQVTIGAGDVDFRASKKLPSTFSYVKGTVPRALKIATGNVADVCLVEEVAVGGLVSIGLGDGDDTLTVTNSTFASPRKIDGGPGTADRYCEKLQAAAVPHTQFEVEECE